MDLTRFVERKTQKLKSRHRLSKTVIISCIKKRASATNESRDLGRNYIPIRVRIETLNYLVSLDINKCSSYPIGAMVTQITPTVLVRTFSNADRNIQEMSDLLVHVMCP